MGIRRTERAEELEAQLESALATIRRAIATTDPGMLSGPQAMSIAGLLGDIERAAASGLALVSPRVHDTGAYTKGGHGGVAEWLGAVTGTSVGTARERLAAAERASDNASFERALRTGSLSASQLSVVGKTGATAPEAVETLLGLVASGASH